MRQTSIEIDGVSYPLCYSVRVVREAIDRFGSLQAMSAAIFSEDDAESVDARLWLLEQEMAAGARYAARAGKKTPSPPTSEDILDAAAGLQLAELVTAAIEVMSESSKTSIDAEAPKRKNADATPGD